MHTAWHYPELTYAYSSDESPVRQTEEPDLTSYPEPEPESVVVQEGPVVPEKMPTPISMPLPSFNEVTTSRYVSLSLPSEIN
jgi:hypothetical protein